VHRDKPFYESLCNFMSSTPVVVMVLAKQNAVDDLRTLMGATNPAQAAAGTIRKQYAISIEQNSIHGSDAVSSAKREIAFFFSEYELSHLELIKENDLDTVVR
jgi:nucleoside-diphosphate kinase